MLCATVALGRKIINYNADYLQSLLLRGVVEILVFSFSLHIIDKPPEKLGESQLGSNAYLMHYVGNNLNSRNVEEFL